MTTTGIIAEFNPFHNGHKYLLERAQGLKVVAMSGNFVQRGEPAIIDKWTRAQMALENGADLVVELPFLVAVQSADYFASGAVDILAKLGIDTLAFGTETALDYNGLSTIYGKMAEQMSEFLTTLPEKLSYPQKRSSCGKNLQGFSSQETPRIIFLLWPTPRLAQEEIYNYSPSNGEVQIIILQKKLWLTLPRPVYDIIGRIQLLWLKVCPMQIFFKRVRK